MEEEKVLLGLDFGLASREVIEILIEDASEPDVFMEIAQANANRPEILALLKDHASTPEAVRTYIAGILHLPARASTEVAHPTAHADGAGQEMKAQTLLQRIQHLTVAQRIQLALKGGREIRGILIKDTNKEVMVSVLENQKITETEIENIARNRSVPDEILRRISRNREWMKSYAVVHALVTNPKTPPGVSVTLVSDLKVRDLVILEKNKNVPEVVRSAAKRLLVIRKPR